MRVGVERLYPREAHEKQHHGYEPHDQDHAYIVPDPRPARPRPGAPVEMSLASSAPSLKAV